jgi:hypothetical protein
MSKQSLLWLIITNMSDLLHLAFESMPIQVELEFQAAYGSVADLIEDGFFGPRGSSLAINLLLELGFDQCAYSIGLSPQPL